MHLYPCTACCRAGVTSLTSRSHHINLAAPCFGELEPEALPFPMGCSSRLRFPGCQDTETGNFHGSAPPKPGWG